MINLNETLNNMTVAELRKLAGQFHITGRSTMKKAELVRELADPDLADLVELSVSLDEPEADEPTDTDEAAAYIEEGLQNDADAGTYSFVNEVAILRDAPGRAIVTAAFDGRTVGGSIVRKGKRLVLVAGTVTVTGNSFEKVAKLFAMKLGFRADRIDVARGF